MKKVIIYILVAIVMLAIASRGMGCGVKDWFDEKINQNNTSSNDIEENDTSYSEDSFEEPVLTPEIYAYANGEKITSVDIYDDGDFTFEVKANACADASADVNITSAPEGAKGELTQNEDEWVFVPDEGIEGDYVITITSLANEELTTTVTVTVAKAPAIETILTCKYQNVGKDKDNDLMLYMVYDDADSFVIATFDGVEYDRGGKATEVHVAGFYKFAYDENTNAISLTSEVYGDEIINALLASFEITKTYTEDANLLNSIILNADYTLSVTYYNQTMTAKLEPYVEDNTDEIEVSTGSEMDESISSLDE